MFKIVYDETKKTAVIELSRTFTMEHRKDILSSMNDIVSMKPKVIGVDFSEVEQVDSMGLGYMIKLSQVASNNRIDLVLLGMNHSVKSLFINADLDKMFKIMTKKEFEEMI